MALFKLDLRPIYARAMGTPSPHRTLAASIARWLDKVGGTLEERSYCFESGSACDLAQSFRRFAEGHGTEDELSILWDELSEFGEKEVTLISGREKAICEVPHLPDSLSC